VTAQTTVLTTAHTIAQTTAQTAAQTTAQATAQATPQTTAQPAAQATADATAQASALPPQQTPGPSHLDARVTASPPGGTTGKLASGAPRRLHAAGLFVGAILAFFGCM